MNFQRLYEYRFRGIDQEVRAAVWNEIAPFVHGLMGSPQRVLDPAAGRCEFINAVPAAERWAIDQADYAESDADPGVTTMVADIMEAELPAAHFDGVWVSNTLEHLLSQEQTAAFLERMRDAMSPGGRIAIMGPNFRYCAKEYFDCADHTLVYTHTAIAEHLYAAGFEPERIVPRFLPYSFRGRLPATPATTRAYLRSPLAWRLLGKQFLVIGRLPAS
jgi:SAM-dependent methyltransferase